MKPIKSLMAISILAIAGASAANAATWNVTATADNITANGEILVNYAGTWDDSTGNGVFDGTVTPVAYSPVVLNISSQPFSMDQSTGAGNLSQITGCTDSVQGQACAGIGPAFKGPMYNEINFSTLTVPGAGEINQSTGTPFTPTDGATYTWTVVTTGVDANNLLTQSEFPLTVTLNAPSAVPLPAAAWLFGSGLIGLAGVARRRRS